MRGATPFINRNRLNVYALLAGCLAWPEAPAGPAVCHGLDWKRALLVHLWYRCQPTATVADALASYERAAAAPAAAARPAGPVRERGPGGASCHAWPWLSSAAHPSYRTFFSLAVNAGAGVPRPRAPRDGGRRARDHAGAPGTAAVSAAAAAAAGGGGRARHVLPPAQAARRADAQPRADAAPGHGHPRRPRPPAQLPPPRRPRGRGPLPGHIGGLFLSFLQPVLFFSSPGGMGWLVPPRRR